LRGSVYEYAAQASPLIEAARAEKNPQGENYLENCRRASLRHRESHPHRPEPRAGPQWPISEHVAVKKAPILDELNRELNGKANVLFNDVWQDNTLAQRFSMPRSEKSNAIWASWIRPTS